MTNTVEPDVAGYLASFLPRIQTEKIVDRDGPADGASQETFEAAILLIDLVGFTALTQRFTEQGSEGAEVLSELITDFFDSTGNVIAGLGGEVLFYAGDSVVAMFRSKGDLSAATRNAAYAAQQIHKLPIRGLDGPLESLRQAAVTAGQVRFLEVGGVEGRWVPLFVGEAFRQLEPTIRAASAGQTTCSAIAWKLLQDDCEGVETGEDAILLTLVSAQDSVQITPPQTPDTAVLGGYIPDVVAEFARQGATDWIAEFRNVSMVFINLPDLGTGDDLALAQKATLITQRRLSQFEGTLHQAIMDEKGISFLLGFGLPPLAHEDDAERALRAAAAIHTDLANAGLESAGGVATGSMFTGVSGGGELRHYSVIGQSINLAARLMQSAGEGVLSDGNTIHLSKGRVRGEPSLPVSAKGFSEPVTVFRVSQALPHAVETPEKGTAHLFGREVEAEKLSKRVDNLLNAKGGAVLVTGEAGIGKSILIADICDRAKAAGALVLSGAGDAMEQGARFFAWRTILRALLSPDNPSAPVSELVEKLYASLQSQPVMTGWIPLLNDVMPLGLEQNELTKQMDGVARDDSTRELMIHLLSAAAEKGPLMIVIDDAHWCESTSLSLIAASALRVPQALFVIGARPEFGDPPTGFARLMSADDTETIRLGGLTEPAVRAIAAARIGVEDVPDALSNFLHDRGDGNPFYTEELALALLENGSVTINDGAISYVDFAGLQAGSALPTSLQGVVTSRIDRLPGTAQIALKASSVIGRVFGREMLSALFPDDADAALDPELSLLAEQALIVALAGSRDVAAVAAADRAELDAAEYAFRHIITRDVAYGLMVTSQRKSLHKLAAEWIAARSAQMGADTPWGLLAYHHDHADTSEKALICYEKAGQAALDGFANREAITFFSRALELAEAIGTKDDQRIAKIRAGLARAHHHLTNYPVAREIYAQALEGFGAPTPRGKFATIIRLLGGVMTQTFGRWRKPVEPVEDPIQMAIITNTRLWQETALFMGDALTSLAGIFSYLNLAERIGATSERLHGYGHLSIMLNVLGMRKAAARYNRRALELVDDPAINLHDRTYVWEVAAVYFSGVGGENRMPEALANVDEGFSRLGDRYRWETGFTIDGYARLAKGDFVGADAAFQKSYDSAHPDGAEQVIIWSLGGLAFARLANGNPDRAIADELASHAAAGLHPTEALLSYGAIAAILDALDDKAGALAAAEQAVQTMESATHVFYYLSWPASAATDVFLKAYEREGEAKYLKRAQVAIKTLKQLGFMNQVAQPRAALIGGRLALAQGRKKRARRLFSRSAAKANALGMMSEAAVANAAIDDLM